jgi:hypothetical protein
MDEQMQKLNITVPVKEGEVSRHALELSTKAVNVAVDHPGEMVRAEAGMYVRWIDGYAEVFAFTQRIDSDLTAVQAVGRLHREIVTSIEDLYDDLLSDQQRSQYVEEVCSTLSGRLKELQ